MPDIGSTDLAKLILCSRAMIAPSSRRMDVNKGSTMRSYARKMLYDEMHVNDGRISLKYLALTLTLGFTTA